MVYTEIQKKGSKKYYYRVKSVKEKGKVGKIRKYLGVNLDKKRLKILEKEANKILDLRLNDLLAKEEKKKLEKLKIKYKKLKIGFENRYETFLAQFTYNTNAIEGNTLSLQETSLILFENRTPEGKSLREINEVLNHKKAFDYILGYNSDINKKFICEIQKLIVKNTLKKELEDQIGKYRKIQVYIHGTEFIPPKPASVGKEMGNLLRWYNKNRKRVHPLILSAYFHAVFEFIHPFVDGNGRTGRLLMNFILHKNKFPMVNIPNKNKLEYYNCLEEARKGNFRKFVNFLYELLLSTQMYI